jgi:hypothetical protein
MAADRCQAENQQLSCFSIVQSEALRVPGMSVLMHLPGVSCQCMEWCWPGDACEHGLKELLNDKVVGIW